MTALKWSRGAARPGRLAGIALAAALVGMLATTPAAAQLFGGRDDSQANVRINQVEEQMRVLTGQIEELNFQIRQLQDQIRRMQEDNEYRFQQLEGSTGNRSDAGGGGTRDLAGTLDDTTGYGPAGGGTLGQLPADTGSGDADYGSEGGYVAGGGAGPLDLSALARGTGGGFAPSGPDTAPPGVSSGAPQDDGFATARVDAGGGDDPRAAYDAAYSRILSGDYAGAEAGFRRFLADHPNDALAANAQFWLGESHYARGDYRAAADAFLKSYTDYPDSAKVTDSLLKLGLSLRGIGQTDAACATFSELLTKYPGAPTAVRAEAEAQKQRSGCA